MGVEYKTWKMLEKSFHIFALALLNRDSAVQDQEKLNVRIVTYLIINTLRIT